MSALLQQRIAQLEDEMLSDLLGQISKEQRALFNRIYPDGVPRHKMASAIDLCERTIKQNIKRAEKARAAR